VSPVQQPLPAVPPPVRRAAPTPPDPAGPASGFLPTGPVDHVPVPPLPRTAPAPPAEEAAAEPQDPGAGRPTRRRVRLPRLGAPRRPRVGRGTAAAVLGAGALLLLEVGLLRRQGGTSIWARVPLWSGFATAAAAAGLAAVAGLRAGPALRDRAWLVGAGGLTGLAVFWLLVVLPTAGTDRGFVLTAALACLGGSVWLTADRGRAAAGTEEPAAPVAEPVPAPADAAPADAAPTDPAEPAEEATPAA
jgi:hypothetical protein